MYSGTMDRCKLPNVVVFSAMRHSGAETLVADGCEVLVFSTISQVVAKETRDTPWGDTVRTSWPGR